jgi:hypothetical protein
MGKRWEKAHLVAAWTRSEVLVAQVELLNAKGAHLLFVIFVDELVLLGSRHCESVMGRVASRVVSVDGKGRGVSGQLNTSAPVEENKKAGILSW